MKKQDIKSVLNKVSAGNASVEDEEMAKLWLHQLHQSDDAGHSSEELEQISAAMWGRLETGKLQNGKTVKLWLKIAVAASIMLVASIGFYFYNNKKGVENIQTAYQNDVAPGKDGATLTLASGKKILINDALAGNIATDAGVKITKSPSGELIYEVTAKENSVIAYNTLTTTRGQQSKVRLPDGTLVFLNSASSLKYPTSFAKKRNVELSGEGYFEVAHDTSKPFIVSSAGQQVEVLGTHFNINSYTDEKDTRTTLLEGSVRLNGGRILKPGEQSALSPAGVISVEQVEVDDVVAWKEGKFIFDSETVESIMRKLSRWYDVEVIYEGNVKNKLFAGTISRQDNISKILEKITLTKAAQFKIEGRRITVMP